MKQFPRLINHKVKFDNEVYTLIVDFNELDEDIIVGRTLVNNKTNEGNTTYQFTNENEASVIWKDYYTDGAEIA